MAYITFEVLGLLIKSKIMDLAIGLTDFQKDLMKTDDEQLKSCKPGYK